LYKRWVLIRKSLIQFRFPDHTASVLLWLGLMQNLSPFSKALLLVSLTFAVYLPALHNGFILPHGLSATNQINLTRIRASYFCRRLELLRQPFDPSGGRKALQY